MNTASTSVAAGLVILLVTLAQFNGHVADLAFFQIIGSVLGTVALANVIAGFK